MSEIRFYRIVKMVELGRAPRWVIVAESLREDETWDVIESKDTKLEAEQYVAGVQARQLALRRS